MEVRSDCLSGSSSNGLGRGTTLFLFLVCRLVKPAALGKASLYLEEAKLETHYKYTTWEV